MKINRAIQGHLTNIYSWKYSFNLPLISFQEPVGHKAPTFSTDAKSITYDRHASTSFALLCPAQAYPQPLFRYTVLIGFWIGLRKSFLGSDTKITLLVITCLNSLNSLRTGGKCSSQSIRRAVTRINGESKGHHFNSLYGSIASYPKLQVNYEFNTNSSTLYETEPLGSVKPKLASKAVETVDHGLGSTFNLLCLGQAFPIPVYR